MKKSYLKPQVQAIEIGTVIMENASVLPGGGGDAKPEIDFEEDFEEEEF